MLSNTSQFTSRARILHTQHAATVRALGAGCAQGIRQRQQTRSFRWGLWSNLDDEVFREIRRQQRMLKHRYSERLNRRLSWENHRFCEDPRHALKRMMKNYWHSSYPGAGFRDHPDFTENTCTDNKGGVRPGRNIEDVERGAMDHLMFGEDEEPLSPHQHPKRDLHRRGVQKLKYTSESYDREPIELDDWIIDPITNRKVAKQPFSSILKNGDDIPVKTFKDYRSQFANPDGVSKQPRSSRQRAWPYIQSDDYAQSHGSEEYEHNQTDASAFGKDGPAVSPETKRAATSVKEGANCVDFLGYEARQDSGLDANLASSVEGLPKTQSDLPEHRTSIKEAQGKFGDLQPPEEIVDDPGYKSVVAHEIGNWVEDVEPRYVDQNETACEHLEQHGPVRDEGKPLGVTEDFVEPGVLHRSRPSIDPMEPGDFPESTVEDLRAKYGSAELKQYTATRQLDSDDTSSLLGEKGSQNYDDLLRWNEERLRERYHPEDLSKDGPHYYAESEGRPQPSAEELSYLETQYNPQDPTYQEPLAPAVAQMEQLLEQLNARPESDSAQHIEAEESLKGSMAVREGLEKLVSVKQGHGRKPSNLQPMAPEGPKNSATAEAPEYPAFPKQGLGRLASVQQGQGKMSNYREMLESLMNQHEKLSDAHDEEANSAVKLAKATSQLLDMPERKLTGNYVRDFPEEFEKSWTQTLSSQPSEAETYEAEAPSNSETMDGGLEGAFGRPSPCRIEPALDRHDSPKAAIDQADHIMKKSDDPETSQNDEIGEQTKQFDSMSDAKDEMATAFEGEATIAAEDEARNSAPGESREGPRETSLGSENDPVLYKILAYDPTMQKINMAETTSFVPDFTSALSPADALLRLSHPAKFFPHFASLEAEGFEIASGSGDVLVFRKVRPSKPEQVEETPADTTAVAAEPSSFESPVNPIDMTGRPKVVSPASANFASPTGYVNYDCPPETDLPPPPPRVAYNINLRREEPVYSGPKQRVCGEQKEKKGLGQRLLIGGVWVAGISYGLGVVSEYFTTGGMDGMGPPGL